MKGLDRFGEVEAEGSAGKPAPTRGPRLIGWEVGMQLIEVGDQI